MALAAVREQSIGASRDLRASASGEVVVYCPTCKALQTLSVVGDTILPTRKFSQRGPRIFHDCSDTLPCRLYRIS